jgi:hypothetical protein
MGEVIMSFIQPVQPDDPEQPPAEKPDLHYTSEGDLVITSAGVVVSRQFLELLALHSSPIRDRK